MHRSVWIALRRSSSFSISAITGAASTPFFARRRMAASRSSLSCLIVSMVLKYYVFGEQNYKTNPNRKHICRLFFTFAPR